MLFGLLCLGAGLFGSACQDAKYDQKVREFEKKGAFVKTNRELENSIFYDYCYEYQYETKEKAPEEYRDFFDLFLKGRYKYFMAMAARDVWKQGYRPYMRSFMPTDEDELFEGFHEMYDEQIKQYNEIATELRVEKTKEDA